MLSPVWGLKTTTVTSTTFSISTSVCPAPTLSIIIGLNPAYSKTLMLFRSDVDIAPVAPLDAMLLMYVPESVDSVILTLSPSIAPPVIWLVGSIARTALLYPSLFSSRLVRFIRVLLPAPAGPVIPIFMDLPECLKIFFMMSLASFSLFSIIDMARAIALLLPFLISATISIERSRKESTIKLIVMPIKQKDPQMWNFK